ncbi:MAG: hypothetical protein KDA71_14195, partial [Planctomycetales bacterium]|nr:hypothetical protein [Planctomycetales bacterium]
MPSILVWLTNAGSRLVAIVLTLLFSGFAMAEDVAIVRSPTGDATVRLTGEILEFRGDGRVMLGIAVGLIVGLAASIAGSVAIGVTVGMATGFALG